MFIHVKHTQIDKRRWDNALLNCTNSRIYACSWYLDLVSPNWEALLTEDYKLLFPLTQRKKFSFNYLYTPPFVQQLGLFCEATPHTNQLVECLDAIPSKFKFIELNLNENNSLNEEGLQLNQNYILPLQKSYEELCENFSSNHKRNLKKAEQASLRMEEPCDVKMIIDLFKNDRGKQVKSFGAKEYELLESLCNSVEQHAELFVKGVFDTSSQLICGAIIFKFGDRLTFIFSGNSETGKSKAAMFFLINDLIKSHATSNLILDFEGSNDAGLAQFYNGFGADKKVYPHVKRNRLPAIVKLLKK